MTNPPDISRNGLSHILLCLALLPFPLYSLFYKSHIRTSWLTAGSVLNEGHCRTDTSGYNSNIAF